MTFLKTRTNEVKKFHDNMNEEYDTLYRENEFPDERFSLDIIRMELQVLNETLAMTCDYLATIANILNSSKGGK